MGVIDEEEHTENDIYELHKVLADSKEKETGGCKC